MYMCYLLLCVCNLVHNVYMYLVHNLALIMHNVYMQAVCNHMNLVRIPRLDHMYLAYYVRDSRLDRGMRSRSPILMTHRNLA